MFVVLAWNAVVVWARVYLMRAGPSSERNVEIDGACLLFSPSIISPRTHTSSPPLLFVVVLYAMGVTGDEVEARIAKLEQELEALSKRAAALPPLEAYDRH